MSSRLLRHRRLAPPNLAPDARATATSEFSDQYLTRFAVDGKIPKAGPQDDRGNA